MRAAAAAAGVLALALAGCGGDDESKAPGTAGGRQDTARTVTEPEPTDSSPGPTPTETAKTETGSSGGGATSPESQPGGAGDEEPARSQAQLTGKGGRISPRRVRVPPFISVRVELRSADGRRYALRIAGRTLAVGGGLSAASTRLAGLRPGRAYVGRGSDGSRVRIEASAEPGP